MAVTINADTTNGLVITPDTSGDLSFQSSGSNIFTIDSSGNTVFSGALSWSGDLAVDTNTLYVDATNNYVGIGTSSPSSKLHVNGTSRFTSTITADSNISFANSTILYSADGGDNIEIRSNNAQSSTASYIMINGRGPNDTIQFRTANTERMLIRADGRLDVAQPIMYVGSGQAMRCNNSEYVQDAVRASGYIQFGTTIGAVGVNYFTSDANKKENIQPSTYNSSLLVENIEFVEFDWKPDAGDEGHVQVGVTAQQLKTLDERLVAELEDGSFMVKEPALVTHLAKALQEQIQKVKDLETRIQALENA